MAGGDQFDIFKQGKNTRSYGLDRQALIEYLQYLEKEPEKWPKIEGRIRQ